MVSGGSDLGGRPGAASWCFEGWRLKRVGVNRSGLDGFCGVGPPGAGLPAVGLWNAGFCLGDPGLRAVTPAVLSGRDREEQ
jgi:hypothetical protein